ncbi:hypothetical protein F5Y10DRAFT_290341 [Nemania abortiva]|nr:hypothetical protein F5Y10DRAFT_290341 [Nemania abortiva]
MPQVTELVWVPLKSNEDRNAAKRQLASVRDQHLSQPGLVASYKGYVLSGPNAVEFANVWESEEAYNASHESQVGEGFKSLADSSPHQAKHRAVVLDGALETLATARVVQVTTVTPSQSVHKAGFSSQVPRFPKAHTTLQGWTAENNQHPSASSKSSKPASFTVLTAYGDLDDYFQAAAATNSQLGALGDVEAHVTVFEKM